MEKGVYKMIEFCLTLRIWIDFEAGYCRRRCYRSALSMRGVEPFVSYCVCWWMGE
jgi:hypothetical protein